MIKHQVTIQNKLGLHARAAAKLVGVAQRFASRIELVYSDRKVDCKSIMGVITLGAKKDETFGAVLLFGIGGVTAELLKDRVLELPPLNERLARGMLEKLRCWPLLKGYRGRPGVDIEPPLFIIDYMKQLVVLMLKTWMV